MFWEAPIFYGLFTFLIVIGAGVILIPKVPLIPIILFSQILNGVLLPFVLIYQLLLVNKARIMHEWVNSRGYNAVAWVAVVVIVGLTLALLAISIRDAVLA
jgi:Mn2+/Fe2+ NRAMP family transporter